MAAITATTRRTKTPPSPKAFEHVSFCGVVCGSFVWASMASFDETPPRNSKNGEKIFKTKCAQCHTIDKGADNKQGIYRHSSPSVRELLCIDVEGNIMLVEATWVTASQNYMQTDGANSAPWDSSRHCL
ncbi:hypothetical protein JHK87_040342 [Glycine soja]|nr:hypothetical protein JHK87_040342 [Glycine soja]